MQEGLGSGILFTATKSWEPVSGGIGSRTLLRPRLNYGQPSTLTIDHLMT